MASLVGTNTSTNTSTHTHARRCVASRELRKHIGRAEVQIKVCSESIQTNARVFLCVLAFVCQVRLEPIPFFCPLPFRVSCCVQQRRQLKRQQRLAQSRALFRNKTIISAPAHNRRVCRQVCVQCDKCKLRAAQLPPAAGQLTWPDLRLVSRRVGGPRAAAIWRTLDTRARAPFSLRLENSENFCLCAEL